MDSNKNHYSNFESAFFFLYSKKLIVVNKLIKTVPQRVGFSPFNAIIIHMFFPKKFCCDLEPFKIYGGSKGGCGEHKQHNKYTLNAITLSIQ